MAETTTTTAPAASSAGTGSTEVVVDANAVAAAAAGSAGTTEIKKEEAPALELKFAADASPDVVAALKTTATELGLDSAKGQKVVDLVGALNAKAAEAQQAFAEKVRNEWVNQLKADKELGGAEFDSAKTLRERAVEKFGGADLATLLKATGLENHPAVARALTRIGKALADDSIGGAGARSGSAELTDEQILRATYSNSPLMFAQKE